MPTRKSTLRMRRAKRITQRRMSKHYGGSNRDKMTNEEIKAHEEAAAAIIAEQIAEEERRIKEEKRRKKEEADRIKPMLNEIETTKRKIDKIKAIEKLFEYILKTKYILYDKGFRDAVRGRIRAIEVVPKISPRLHNLFIAVEEYITTFE